jgi:hypothetical protein
MPVGQEGNALAAPVLCCLAHVSRSSDKLPWTFLPQECNVWVVELKMCPGFWLKAWLAGLASVLPSLLRPDAPPDMLVVGSARP